MAGIILLSGSALFSGCYTLKQGLTLLGYLGRAVPLESLAEVSGGETPGLSAGAFAEQVEDIRRFAMEELGLKESANYTKYVELDRAYLAAVVSAAAKDSFTRYEWWYPVLGKMPYKGFFDVKDARKEAEKLRRKDLDVWIRGVDAFSTLGWFKDPLYSYMRGYPPHRLADLIIHELLHATIYLKNQAQFNEELAEFVGGQGARLYMEKRFGPDSEEYRAMADGGPDRDAFIAFIRELIAALEAVYQSGVSREEKLARKETIIRSAQKRFEETYDSRFRGNAYRSFAGQEVNNAYLELYRLYHAEENYFEELYRHSGLSLADFIAAVKTLNGKENPRIQLERALGRKEKE
jgi:predicted aminopeptidase